MSTVEIKWRITSSLDNLSDTALAEMLEHLEQLEKAAAETSDMDKTFQRILREDANLLNRLAQ